MQPSEGGGGEGGGPEFAGSNRPLLLNARQGGYETDTPKDNYVREFKQTHDIVKTVVCQLLPNFNCSLLLSLLVA